MKTITAIFSGLWNMLRVLWNPGVWLQHYPCSSVLDKNSIFFTALLGDSVELPIIIEYPERNQWAVSLGGHNPPAELCWDCKDIDKAWRLHDAIYKLAMKIAPNLSVYAISEPRLRSLLDQMSQRESLWNEFGTLQAAQYEVQKDL